MAALAALIVPLAGCSDTPALASGLDSFRVSFVGNPNLGTVDNPRSFSTDTNKPNEFFIDVEALRDGRVDTSFDGWAVLSVRPGSVVWIAEPAEGADGAIKFDRGVARNVRVRFARAYCTVRLVVTDVGFVRPPDISKAACDNKRDDDGDGYIDSPDDRGCHVLKDDDEEGGSGASGASPPIHFRCPLIADVQRPILGQTGEKSPLEKARVTIDRGWLLVTRVGVDGLYVTDFDGVTWDGAAKKWDVKPEGLSYDSVFAYNYSTPLNLQEGDCLTQLDGDVDEFYGFTELNKPTWKKGDFAYCAAKAVRAGLVSCPVKYAGPCTDASQCPASFSCENRRCVRNGTSDCSACPGGFTCEGGTCVPDQDSDAGKTCRERIEDLANTPVDITSLMIKEQGADRSVWDQSYMMTERFESGLVQISNVSMFTEPRKCDSDNSGSIEFDNDAEKKCSNDCGSDIKCIVLETYKRYNQWTVHFKDGAGEDIEASVVTAGAIQDFDPLDVYNRGAGGKPVVLKRIAGTLRHLVFGRPPWIIETRWPSDCPDCTTK